MDGKGYDFLYKIVLVGDLGVGKTSIARRFAEGKFSEEHKSTIGVDFTVQTVQIEDKIVKVRNSLAVITTISLNIITYD